MRLLGWLYWLLLVLLLFGVGALLGGVVVVVVVLLLLLLVKIKWCPLDLMVHLLVFHLCQVTVLHVGIFVSGS